MFDQERWNRSQKSVDEYLDNGDYHDDYAEFLMNHTDTPIGNGTMLINAMERQECWDSFVEYLCEREYNHAS
jgi:hypothetical protein